MSKSDIAGTVLSGVDLDVVVDLSDFRSRMVNLRAEILLAKPLSYSRTGLCAKYVLILNIISRPKRKILCLNLFPASSVSFNCSKQALILQR